jgi:hypothetical protein
MERTQAAHFATNARTACARIATTHHHLQPFSEHPGVPPEPGDFIGATCGAVGARKDVDHGQRLRRGGDLRRIEIEENDIECSTAKGQM